MQKQFKFLYWAADMSMEVLNGLMFLDHFAKLELILRLGLKTYTLTPGVMWISLLGVRTIISTCALLHAASVTISLTLIVWSSFKLSRERSSHDVSQTLVTRSCLMTTDSKVIGPIDNFWIPLVMWVSTLGLILGSTCSLESIIFLSDCLTHYIQNRWLLIYLSFV